MEYDTIKLENQLYFPLCACAKEIVRQYRRPLAPLGQTYTQYVVMMVLWDRDSLSEKELGQAIHLDSGTLAPLIKCLEKQGLVTRKRPAHNERTLLISLTDRGCDMKRTALSVTEAMKLHRAEHGGMHHPTGVTEQGACGDGRGRNTRGIKHGTEI